MGEFLDSHPFLFYHHLMFYDLVQRRGWVWHVWPRLATAGYHKLEGERRGAICMYMSLAPFGRCLFILLYISTSISLSVSRGAHVYRRHHSSINSTLHEIEQWIRTAMIWLERNKEAQCPLTHGCLLPTRTWRRFACLHPRL
jgi:hypothetical protein